MTEDQATEQDGQEVEMIYDATEPSGDLESHLEVKAIATVKGPDGQAAGYKGARGFYRFGKDLEEARELFGDEVVFTNFRSQAKIRCQALMRSHILAGKDVGEMLSVWKPGVQMERTPVDPLVAAERKFDTLSDEDKQAFIDKLMQR